MPKSLPTLSRVTFLPSAEMASVPSTVMSPVWDTAPPEVSVKSLAVAEANSVATVFFSATSYLVVPSRSPVVTVTGPVSLLPALLTVMPPSTVLPASPVVTNVALPPATVAPPIVMPPLLAVAERAPLVALTSPDTLMPLPATSVASFCACRLPVPLMSPAVAVASSEPLVVASALTVTSPVVAVILRLPPSVETAPSAVMPVPDLSSRAPVPLAATEPA